MKIAANIAGVILGLLFVMASSMFFAMFVFHVMEPPKDDHVKTAEEVAFQASVMATPYMVVVKICELIGAILVAIPKTRNWGLLCLGPIIINILCYHAFIAHGVGLFDPMLLVICILALFLLWAGRKSFAALLN